MEYVTSVNAFVLTLLAFHIYINSVESYNLTCPSQAHWKFRAIATCNSTLKYFCLYNNVEENYVEGCTGPDWDRKGSKRIFSGFFTRGHCFKNRYQPFNFQTNGSMSNCIYTKSICSEEGQIVHNEDSTIDDRTCRCDFKKNYSFLKTPKKFCYCNPVVEDCTCYIKSCPVNLTLLADYDCSSNGYHENQKCIDISKHHGIYTVPQVKLEKINLLLNTTVSVVKWRESDTAVILVGCVLVLVAGLCFFWVLFAKWTIGKYQYFKRYLRRHQTELTDRKKRNKKDSEETIEENSSKSFECTSVEKDHNSGNFESRKERVGVEVMQSLKPYSGNFESRKERVGVEVMQSLKPWNLSREENNFLRLIHLVFRVACPVVRMIFNNEIQPNQLRKTLDINKESLIRKTRKKEKIINDVQWDLLFPKVIVKTVTSEDFDIRLMIYLLRIIAKINVGDKVSEQSDRSTSGMLSRIKNIRNEVTRRIRGELPDLKFNLYWDTIGNAVLKLVSSYNLDMDDQEKIQLVSRLLVLNPLSIDYTQLSIYIDMSEKYPALILKKIIHEYCTSRNLTIADVLREEKHQLYHKRKKTEGCCKCTTEVCTVNKVIAEKQWEALYERSEGNNTHSCPCRKKTCIENFVPKTIKTCDLSATIPLLLYSQNMLEYIISRLYKHDFNKFLMYSKHTLYHCMVNKMCCKCTKAPTEKLLIRKKEWNKLYKKENEAYCQNGTTDCCCLFSVLTEIKSSDIDDNLLGKIFYLAGPIGVLNKIIENGILSYLNWTAGDKILNEALTDILNMLKEEIFSRGMLKRISSCKDSQQFETITKKQDAKEWVCRHFDRQKNVTDPQHEILVHEKGCFSVKSIHIPKEFPLANPSRQCTHMTSDEYHFLVVFHGLTKIIYPVIKEEFNKHCNDEVLDTIRKNAYDEKKAMLCQESRKDEHKSRKKRIYLTQDQLDQLFPQNPELPKNVDLKWMINILKHVSEESDKKEYVEHLKLTDEIRREIMQSSSGVLNKTRFQDILKLTIETVLYFGGQLYQEKVLNLQNIKIF